MDNAIEVTVAQLEERQRVNDREIKELKDGLKTINEQNIAIIQLANSVEKLATKTEAMNDKVDALGNDLIDMKDKITEVQIAPAKSAAKSLSAFKVAFIAAIAGIVANLVYTAVQTLIQVNPIIGG